MPTYVYGCDKDKSHPRGEVFHGINEDPVIICDECGSTMHRIPQPMRFYMNPSDVLYSWMDEKYVDWRKKRNGHSKRSKSR